MSTRRDDEEGVDVLGLERRSEIAARLTVAQQLSASLPDLAELGLRNAGPVQPQEVVISIVASSAVPVA